MLCLLILSFSVVILLVYTIEISLYQLCQSFGVQRKNHDNIFSCLKVYAEGGVVITVQTYLYLLISI